MVDFIKWVLFTVVFVCAICVYFEAVGLRDKNRYLADENEQLRYNLLQFKVKHGYHVNED